MSEGRFRLLLTLEPESVHTRCLLHRLACQGVNSRNGACGGAGRDLLSSREAATCSTFIKCMATSFLIGSLFFSQRKNYSGRNDWKNKRQNVMFFKEKWKEMGIFVLEERKK